MCQREVAPGGGKGPDIQDQFKPYNTSHTLQFLVIQGLLLWQGLLLAASRWTKAAKTSSLLQRYVYLRIDWISLINLPHHHESFNFGDPSHRFSYP